MESAATTTKLLIATLQKYGYDLEDADGSHQPVLTRASGSSSSSTSSGSSTSPRDSVPRGSFISSAGILQLRERKNDQTALHIAAKKGHLEVLRALAKLPRVEDCVNSGDRHANTALHFAASSAKECGAEMVELMLSLGADVHAVNVRGQTPLVIHIMTVKDDNPAITRMFIKHGVALNELINGTTYLHLAVSRNLLEIASALVAGGASINVPDTNGAMVGDTIPRKTLVKLICNMTEGTQRAPPGVTRHSCKICKQPKGMLETYKDCNLCGRVVCKNCSKKASEIRTTTPMALVGEGVVSKERDPGRLCTVCCTVVLLRDKKHQAKVGFNQKLYGSSMQ